MLILPVRTEIRYTDMAIVLVELYLAVESLVLSSQSEVGGIIGIATNPFKPGQIFFVFYLGEEHHQRVLRTYLQIAVD